MWAMTVHFGLDPIELKIFDLIFEIDQKLELFLFVHFDFILKIFLFDLDR